MTGTITKDRAVYKQLLNEVLGEAGELQDNRFAVINGTLIEVISYDCFDNGDRYDVLTVRGAPDVCNPSEAGDLREITSEEPEEVIVFINCEPKFANAYFTGKIAELIVKFN